MKHVLITGGSGFIGSHVVDHLLANTDWQITVLDSLTYAGEVGKLTESKLFDPKRVRVFWHDLNAPIMETLAAKIRGSRRAGLVDYILNMASASHIDQSIIDPVPFARNNVNIALHALEYARAVKPEVFVQFSTDEVYGSVARGVQLPEWSPINPSNPYSASKAAQECLAIAWWRTYGVPVIITNLMNNYGERQDPEKFVPKVIRLVQAGEEVVLHGTPDNPGSRFYLHARNAADAILFLLRRNPASYPEADQVDRFNIVGDQCIDNLDLAQRVAAIVGKPLRYRFEHNPRSRPGHDLHYGLDGAKLAALGWRAPVEFNESLERTVKWIIANQ